MAVEVALVYGGALAFQPNGDLVLSQDVPGNSQATYERILRIILTNPTITDASGVPIGRPDDLFHPAFGSGVRAAVGEPFTPSLVAQVTSRIVAALTSDASIASVPPPTVSMVQLSPGTIQLIVSCTSVLGEALTLPPFQLSATGLAVTGGS